MLIRILLVIQVVNQTNDSPFLNIFIKKSGKMAHDSFN